MASNEFAALCAVSSFLRLFYSLQGHILADQPRLSSLLLLLIASLSSFIASFIPQWIRRYKGKFEDDLQLRGDGHDSHSDKPHKRFLIILIVSIITRLELFHRVSEDLQCSAPGIESFLPLLILVFEMRRTKARKDDDDDMGETIYEALSKWIHEFLTDSHHFYILSIFMLSIGSYLATSQTVRSTFFCSPDPSSLVIWFQFVGLLLDCAIVILSWKLFSWTQTTKTRLKTLSNILLSSAVGSGFVYWGSRYLQSPGQMSYHLGALDSLPLVDVAVNGLALSVFLIFSTLIVADGNPLPLVGVLTFLSAMIPATQRIKAIGSWENLTPAITTISFALLCLGFILFIFAGGIRSVLLIRRTILALILVVVVITTTIYSIVKGNQVFNYHPLSRIIYESRTGANRWLLQASTSSSLIVAVREYQERHHGRDPPAKFDIWYDFASLRYSPIIDHFPQIDSDILPFLGIAPEKIREDIRRLSLEPGIAIVTIKAGRASHNLDAISPEKGPLDDLVDMINQFAEHIPDMELAINTNEAPRVLAPWDEVQRATSTGERTLLSKHSKRDTAPDNEKNESPPPLFKGSEAGRILLQTGLTSVGALREMTAYACPPRSGLRSGTLWNTRDFCSNCAKPQSRGQYPLKWALYQELCHQPDLLRLHSFFMTSPKLQPIQELVPVFSRSKTDNHRDILIPLRRADEPLGMEYNDKSFIIKKKALFWRGSVERQNTLTAIGHDLFHGGHQERLVHLVNNQNNNSHERITLVLPEAMLKMSDGTEKITYTHQQTPAHSFNNLLPFDIGFTNYTGPSKGKEQMTIKPPPPTDDQNQDDANSTTITPPEELLYQYVLTIDTDSGPPSNFLTLLRSKSVPFYGSIFKEWYTERLMPWVHFVPVDLRWHALHSTLAYFTGIEPPKPAPASDNDENKEKDTTGKNTKPAGRAVRKRNWEGMSGNVGDANWIAEEGMKWANKALRREDMEVYLFRLLLEWARVVSDNREEMGFVLS
ncbi:glycosyltransferase [Naviculisporaceae sp. PSN 640]